ncbi:MAG: peptidase T [Clostridia bacterium]|nr:peptidase T [Clostridia bacterium]
MTDHALLAEGVSEKFMQYVKVNTQSSDLTDDTPSTPGQWDLARVLETELLGLGLSDVCVDEHCFVIGRLPSNLDQPAPAVGFMAHLDTVPGVPGAGVVPVMHREYQGGEIHVGHGVILSPADSPSLAGAVGEDIITSDGSTLLGADDKAGIAAIVQALAEMTSHPDVPRPEVWVAFTPDEETGKGVGRFPYDKFGARVAYTLDGGASGELSEETFEAMNGVVTINGVSSHTGAARGKMVNAIHLAAQLISSIPAGQRPETTFGREGFIHPNDIEGNVEHVAIKLIIRDFDATLAQAREEALLRSIEALRAHNTGAEIKWTRTGGYRNMKEALDRDPRTVEFAREAMRLAGMRPSTIPIRGGTDGARLSFGGILTPNIFTGGGDAHSRGEWVSVQGMERAAQVMVNLAGLWASQACSA